MQTTDNTHDPPVPASLDDDVLMARPAADPASVEALTAARAHLTASPTYRLLAAALSRRFGPTEPLDLIRDMAGGRYRWRRRDGVLLLVNGERQPDHMSFRVIAAELKRVTGETVTYETLRRWWERVWPDTSIPDAPARQAAAEAGDRLRERMLSRPVGDRAAVASARAEAAERQSNADVPPAAFLPPGA